MNTSWNSLTKKNVVWWIDPKPEQIDFFSNLLNDKGFTRVTKNSYLMSQAKFKILPR